LLEKLVYSMVADPSNKFCVFEACHHGDRARFTSCLEEMEAIMACDFEKVEHLFWWGYAEEGMQCGSGSYSPPSAAAQCQRAELRVFKTIHMHHLSLEALPLVSSVQGLKVINLVRDPRDVFMSAIGMGMVTPAVKSLTAEHDGLGLLAPGWGFYSGGDPGPIYITYMCEMLLGHARSESPDILQLRYEDLTGNESRAAVRRVYDFLGNPLDHADGLEVGELLGGNASGPVSSQTSFTWTCEEMAAFESPPCAEALTVWGYRALHPWEGASFDKAAVCSGKLAPWRDIAIKMGRLFTRFGALF